MDTHKFAACPLANPGCTLVCAPAPAPVCSANASNVTTCTLVAEGPCHVAPYTVPTINSFALLFLIVWIALIALIVHSRVRQ